MPLKPPPHPQPVKAGLERVGLYGTRWGFKAGALGVVLLWAAHTGVPAPLPAPPPLDGALPLQQWTTGGNLGVIASALPGAIPRPGPNQKRSGQCDPGRSEVEIRGGCWVKTEHPLPCPDGKQWEHDGRCYLPVAHAKPVPTTGEIHPGNVAGEAQ
jgi:hypothetical protein